MNRAVDYGYSELSVEQLERELQTLLQSLTTKINVGDSFTLSKDKNILAFGELSKGDVVTVTEIIHPEREGATTTIKFTVSSNTGVINEMSQRVFMINFSERLKSEIDGVETRISQIRSILKKRRADEEIPEVIDEVSGGTFSIIKAAKRTLHKISKKSKGK